LKKKTSDVGMKEHFSNKNENTTFENLKTVLGQQPITLKSTNHKNFLYNLFIKLLANLNDNSQNIERNIKQFNVIYPNISMNNNSTSISPQNVYTSPINPNFNPLLSQQNQPNFNNPRGNQLRNDPQMFVFNQKAQAASPKNYNAIPPANLFKTFNDQKPESQAIKDPKYEGNINMNNNNPVCKKENEKNNNLIEKPAEKQIEKKDSKESEPKLDKKELTEQKTTEENKSSKFFF